MKSFNTTLLALLVVFPAGFACGGKSTISQHTASTEYTLVGQLLLPSGTGSRGVEILVSLVGSESEPPVVWVLFDEEGRFAHSFRRSATSVKVTAGSGAEVHRFDAEQLPEVNQAGQIDFGVIDLRDQLTKHQQVIRAAEGTLSGEIRVAMWSGPPPRGPNGESVSLGSRQFPPVMFSEELEWLIPNEAQSIYFLVERPSELGSGPGWRSGSQRLFGPFNSANVPAELVVD